MNVDTAIQNMLFKSSDGEIEDIAYLARKERDDIISRYQAAYNWTIAQCEEFLDNVSLAYDLLVKGAA
jgi:hypothetical protein